MILLSALSCPAQDISMLYMAQAGYQPDDVLKRAESFFKETGIKVHLFFAEYEDQYAMIMESAEKEVSDYDIILLDLIWTADFANRNIIDPVPPSLRENIEKGIVPEIFLAFQYREKLWAMPFLANFQLFFVNMDLLNAAGFSSPPETLEEMVDMARRAKELGILKYPIFDSLRKQEALVCEYVWLTGAFGGTLINDDGSLNLTSEPAVNALSFLHDLLSEGLLNPYSLNAEEVFASEVFLAGDCLFTTNWTFLTGLIRDSQLPISRSGNCSLIPISARVSGVDQRNRTSTVSGFQGLSVARNSNNKEQAWRFIKYISSPDFQRMHLEEMSIWEEVWSEDRSRNLDPEIEIKRKQILAVHNRPIHPQYRQISMILQDWIYKALLGEVTPEAALNFAQKQIETEVLSAP